jgi:quinol-cytochrome oxidoreductase complex cytochrome b subunit
MDAARRVLAWKVGGVALFALASAVAFAGYLRPDMLIAAWNTILLCF